LLTVLGIIALIYAAVIFVNNSGSSGRDIKALTIYGILGFIFFVSGIGLVKTTKDES